MSTRYSQFWTYIVINFGSKHGDLGVIGAVHFNPHTYVYHVFTLAEPSSEAFYCCGRSVCYRDDSLQGSTGNATPVAYSVVYCEPEETN